MGIMLAMHRRNVLITGGAGVGKTTTMIPAIIAAMQSQCKTCAVVSSTGASASVLNQEVMPFISDEGYLAETAAKTINAFSGLGRADRDIGYYRTKLLKKLTAVFSKLDCLIVDEVSMIGIPLSVYNMK